MGLLVVFFALSILFSFLCSIWEAVLLSITPSYIKGKVQEGNPIGLVLENFKTDIDKPLSAILTLNTIAHTVGAIGVGAQAGKIFGENHFSIGPLELSYESIIASVMTLAILILSEIIPKTMGANNWKRYAPFTVRSLQILLIVLRPFVWLSQLITKTFKKDKGKSVFSRADIAVMAQEGEDSGELNKSESTIIKNLLQFEKLTIRDIMTPKTVALMGAFDQTVKDFYDQKKPIRYSRIPIYKETTDEIIGIALKDELLQNIAEGNPEITLETLVRKVNFVHEDMPLPELFNQLTKEKQHLSIVVDDFGVVLGLVTMEDLFETLLGREIMDEMDAVANLQDLAKKKWENKNKTDE
ncbi:MAG: hemolysin family protein [Bacteroidota bacterium]